MILLFPDLETLRLVITSGQIATEICLAPARFSVAEDRRWTVESLSPTAPKTVPAALKRLGVKSVSAHVGPIQPIECWLQALPLEKQVPALEVTSQTPILFDVRLSQLSSIVTEMLRLGNDRQSYRFIESLEKPTNAIIQPEKRVLLKVVGPPYYTLLRAIDRLPFTTTEADAETTPLVGYHEVAPGVWIELGYSHPLASQIRLPDKQILLIRPPHNWTFVADASFADIYQLLEFQLPGTTTHFTERELKGKLKIPLRLVPGNAADLPEMWLITRDAVDTLDGFVRDADEETISRLNFAVAENDAAPPTILLRARPSKQATPPLIVFENAIGFKAHKNIKNLYLPVGTRLQPTLRADSVRRLFGREPGRIMWLVPEENGRFVPESLLDEAFRPLEQWVDYVMDADQEKLLRWIEATRFQFEEFQCDERVDSPDDPGSGKAGKKASEAERSPANSATPVSGNQAKKSEPGEKRGAGFATQTTGAYSPDRVAAPEMTMAPALPPEHLRKQREELEKQFLEQTGPLDSPERLALWPRLAAVYGSISRSYLSDAAICWLNGMWEMTSIPAAWIDEWLSAEDPLPADYSLARRLDEHLNNSQPSSAELRAFVVRVLWALQQVPVPRELIERLQPITRYLEVHEKLLGTRAIWLVHRQLTQQKGADVLGLARVRDRILTRLLEEKGLNPEHDLPGFLRIAGKQDSERVHVIRERVFRIYHKAQEWASRGPRGEAIDVNTPYIDLLFAFGLAHLGDVVAARDLLTRATRDLLNRKTPEQLPDPIHAFLASGFSHRIQQAIEGKPHRGPLPKEIMKGLLEHLARPSAANKAEQRESQGWYAVQRLCDQSWILEPEEKIDPYSKWKSYKDPLIKEIFNLPQITDLGLLRDRTERVLRDANLPKQSVAIRILAYQQVLGLAARLGEETMVPHLLRLRPIILESQAAGLEEEWRTRGRHMLARGLFLAGHFHRAEIVHGLFDCFLEMARGQSGKSLFELVSIAARETLRSLRRVGLKDELPTFVTTMTGLLVGNKTLTQLRAHNPREWHHLLSALLSIAEGSLALGLEGNVQEILDEALRTLCNEKLFPLEITSLARSYISAIGQGPVEATLDHYEALFPKLPRLANNSTSKDWYSRLHLAVVEEVIRILVSEHFTMSETARRWLEDDEYLVRRRIHMDMQVHLKNMDR